MKLHQTQTEFNCGIDLHARSMYICVMDKEGKILVHRNVRNNVSDKRRPYSGRDFAAPWYQGKLIRPSRWCTCRR